MNTLKQKSEALDTFIPLLVGIACVQAISEWIHNQNSCDIVWLDNYLRQSAFKLNWKWMI
jgi:hypothetical protein